MKHVLIMLIAATLLSHRLEAQTAAPTRPAPVITTLRVVKPVAITTDILKFTGTRFTPKSLTTEKLVFSGWRWMPLAFKTDAIVFTGTRAVITLPGGLR
jgi:hypothetical protein